MMGLPSPYLLFTEENIPIIRGASQVYGLSFTPGTWIENLQITKGAGSVINGYESMTGQINAELKKPLTSEKFKVTGFDIRAPHYEMKLPFTVKQLNIGKVDHIKIAMEGMDAVISALPYYLNTHIAPK